MGEAVGAVGPVLPGVNTPQLEVAMHRRALGIGAAAVAAVALALWRTRRAG